VLYDDIFNLNSRFLVCTTLLWYYYYYYYYYLYKHNNDVNMMTCFDMYTTSSGYSFWVDLQYGYCGFYYHSFHADGALFSVVFLVFMCLDFAVLSYLLGSCTSILV
jgi:hypothetical protein